MYHILNSLDDLLKDLFTHKDIIFFRKDIILFRLLQSLHNFWGYLFKVLLPVRETWMGLAVLSVSLSFLGTSWLHVISFNLVNQTRVNFRNQTSTTYVEDLQSRVKNKASKQNNDQVEGLPSDAAPQCVFVCVCLCVCVCVCARAHTRACSDVLYQPCSQRQGMSAAVEMPIQLACMLQNAVDIGRAAPEDNNVSTQHRRR